MTKHDESTDEIARLIASGSPGVETALQVLEGAEHVYYGALTATTMPVVLTTSATTPPGAEVS